MNNPYYQWALKHGVSLAAIHELMRTIGIVENANYVPDLDGDERGEALVQANERIAASERGVYAYRNNNGALKDEKTGRVVRFGLANDSSRINKVFKSSDLIGFYKVDITPDMVGRCIARFWARECKKPYWHFTGTEEEVAQQSFINLVNSCGGDAAFTNGDY